MIPSFLVLSWALTFGYLPDASVVVGRDLCADRGVEYGGSFHQTIELGLTAWDFVTLWTNIETYEKANSATVFSPFRSDYNIGLNVGGTVAGFRLDAGITHECIHPVYSGGLGKWVAGGTTEIYLKASGKIGGK